MDRNNEISIDNFKNILIYTLKFTTNQNELEHLINILFANKTKSKLSRMDFHKIFSLLLPNNGPAASLLSTQFNIEENDLEEKKELNKTSPFLIEGNSETQFNITAQKRKLDHVHTFQNKEGSSNLENSDSNINNIIKRKTMKDTTSLINTNRNLEELGKLVFEHRMKMGGDISKIFKNLDKDGSMGIDKKELRLGYKLMGIELSDVELNRLWREISPDNKNISYARFKEFHDKIFMPNTRKAIPINQDN
jgi:Ca2+-binding EF-hand superfamily protein